MLLCTIFLDPFSPLQYLHRSQGQDSWNTMQQALNHYRQFPDIPIYQKLLIEEGVKFQYPPSSLLLFDIPERITGVSYGKIMAFYNVLCWISVSLIIVFTSKTLTLIIKKYNFQTIKLNIHPAVLYVLIGIVTIFFSPLIRSYALGQIQTILTNT